MEFVACFFSGKEDSKLTSLHRTNPNILYRKIIDSKMPAIVGDMYPFPGDDLFLQCWFHVEHGSNGKGECIINAKCGTYSIKVDRTMTWMTLMTSMTILSKHINIKDTPTVPVYTFFLKGDGISKNMSQLGWVYNSCFQLSSETSSNCQVFTLTKPFVFARKFIPAKHLQNEGYFFKTPQSEFQKMRLV